MYRFAIIGCGRISARHAENINRIGKLLAVCDIIPAKADELANKYKAKSYYSIDDLLKNEPGVDVISICTPNGLHAEHSIKSLRAGKRVLCEKPLCISVNSALEVLQVEKETGKKLFVVKSTRYNPLLQKLKTLLTRKQLGKIYSFHLSCIWNRPTEYFTDWKGKIASDGGTLYTQFSHYIDALIWLLGDIEEVKGFKSNFAHPTIEFEDSGAVALKMSSGSIGSFHWSVNAFKKNHEIALTIIAEKGTIRLGGEYLNEVQYVSAETDPGLISSEVKANDYQFYKGSMSNHKEVYDHLLKVLDHDDLSFTDAYDGLKTVETIESIYNAAYEAAEIPEKTYL
ncbi:MAG: Gfo/Idh/MocA family protein [Candidatus Dadabacteria bacterium]